MQQQDDAPGLWAEHAAGRGRHRLAANLPFCHHGAASVKAWSNPARGA